MIDAELKAVKIKKLGGSKSHSVTIQNNTMAPMRYGDITIQSIILKLMRYGDVTI